MRLVDSRRLRGPNLQTPGPAAVAEVLFEEGEDPAAAIEAWEVEAGRMARALGWKVGKKTLVARRFAGGAALALEAPVDALLEATDVNDWAIARASDRLARRRTPADRAFAAVRRSIAASVARHANPALVALRRGALRRDVAFLWDDDRVTLGMGAAAETFDVDRLPAPRDVRWRARRRIPVALVTGTNGKTTTARLLARMARLAGKTPGCTSTDGIAIDERLVEEGDFTGAEGARTVLRSPEVGLAILETARGGILRRGLAVEACDAAVVTNVASDHLGEFGVMDLATMARAKAVVGTVVRPSGRVVLNADDPLLAAMAGSFRAPTVLFARAWGPALAAHARAGRTVFTVRGGAFVRVARGGPVRLGRVAAAPLTFGGAAPHNVENCLAAAATAWALGLPDAAVRRALRTFGASPADNPGRGEVVALAGGVKMLLDFGHNGAGLHDLFALAASLLAPGARLVSAHTQPGDRTPDDVAGLAREIARAAPRRVAFWESEDYRRGRAPGAITRALTDALLAEGFARASVRAAGSETEAIEAALSAARPGDVLVVAPHIDRAAVHAWASTRQP